MPPPSRSHPGFLQRWGRRLRRAGRRSASADAGGGAALDQVRSWAAGGPERVLFSRRAGEILALVVDPAAPGADRLDGHPMAGLRTAARGGDVGAVLLSALSADGAVGPPVPAPELLGLLRSDRPLPERRQMPAEASDPAAPSRYSAYLDLLARRPELIDFAYNGHKIQRSRTGDAEGAPPFDDPVTLPRLSYPAPKRPSALFVHNNYYHFNVLAAALRKRGWDALTVSVEPHDSAQRQFMHGEDLNLYNPDGDAMQAGLRAFLAEAPARFGALHFTGQGMASLFPQNFEAQPSPSKLPWDFFELRRHRMLIGFTPSGCCDVALQSSIKQVTGGLCSHCLWETRPDVCSDAKNGAWLERMAAVCDWVALDADWAVDQATGPRYVREPVVCGLDARIWRPGLTPPRRHRIERARGEVIVYHAVGNYAARTSAERDLKGTGAVFAAVEQLQAEGLPVRLMFVTDVPSTEIRYLQAQADIVVDQLHYGRPGANARECLMLGKPVVAKVSQPPAPGRPLRYLAEAPIVHADTDTLTGVLRDLVRDPSRRARLGKAGRAFALKWHGADVCATKYGRVLERLRAGLAPEEP